MELKAILSTVDHTLLAQGATWEQIRGICDDGMKYATASVCIPASYVKQVKEYVGDKLAVCTVIGFPNGYSTTAVKCFETEDAVKNGADEIDMVINIGWVKDKKWDALLEEIKAVKAACHHASRYFLLNNRGAIAPGYLADFAVIDNFKDFNVEMVFKKGVLYWNNGELRDFEAPKIEEYLDKRAHDTFHVSTLTPDDFRDTRQRGVLGMVPGEIITTDNGYADHVDLEKDILKIAVVERHKGTHHLGLGYIQGYGLKSGAVATSISHDSHNIIVVGTNSADMAFAANYIVEHHGGIVVVENGTVKGSVVLEIAGIMSDRPLTEVNDQLEAAKDAAFTLGVSRGIDPFMTLSFMALPVIPKLRITTRGVVDVDTQQYV